MTSRADVDRDLIDRARRGDQAAFAEIAARASDRLFAVAFRVMRDQDAARDALQAALVQIWRDLPTLRDPDRFEGWSYRVLLNCCRAEGRRARARIGWIDLGTGEPTVGDSQVGLADRDALERAFHALTEDQRVVLVLFYYRDLSIAEIATMLGASSGTVKSRLHHARRAMRAAIEAEDRASVPQERTA